MRFLPIVRRLTAILLVLGVGALLALLLFVATRRGPEDLPWTPLDLGEPIGLATRGKLVALAGDAPACTALLDRAGVRYSRPPDRTSGAHCGYDDAVALRPGGANGLALAPADLGTSCAVAAALVLWEWQVVQPAALRHFGVPAARIEHFGSYSCRRIYGRAEGANWSEHARARAIDVAGVRLADGRRIGVAADWTGKGAEAAFLRDIRDGACTLFATTLSPDYNRAHHDHLHLDMAARGGFGVCR
ncbi:extensin family protein [Sphingomonas naphthae]|uniref:Extensin family protein n=1 Tax=Sphingomonas naphthae TaxID=1813468 RepID=A0ABY7THP2_9SPHN|nr:extensin family protein [Sphingomonas naphthae]WCT72398.1 extensin family protein [Sphingomonas naphthae]